MYLYICILFLPLTFKGLIIIFKIFQNSDFSCDDGICLDRFAHCNQLSECANGEDEIDCRLLQLPDGYNRFVPVASHKEILDLEVTIILLNILKVDDMESYFTIQFGLEIEWLDPRLLFLNLQEKENAVNYEEWSKIWIPNFSLYPTKFFEETAYLSSGSTALLQLSLNDSTVFDSVYSDKRNSFIYPGSNVKILKDQKLTVDFICAYNWINYPFDTQICNISLQLISLRSDQVEIVLEVFNSINAFSTFTINMNNSFVEYRKGGISL